MRSALSRAKRGTSLCSAFTRTSLISDQPRGPPPSARARDDGSLDQRLFRHCAQGELRDRPYVFAQELSSFAEIGRGLEIGDAKKLSIFPNCRSAIVRPDTAWIGPGMNRNQGRGHRGGHMHRAAIDAND